MSTKSSTTFSNCPSASLPNLSGRYIDNGTYRLVQKIGQGSWGVVYLATTVKTFPRKLLAVKCVAEMDPDDNLCNSMEREVLLQARCADASPYVLNVHDVVEDLNWRCTFIITDYCPDGDLLDQLTKKQYFSDDERIRNTYMQILDAVEACHNVGIYHRDLKPENILCKDGGKSIALTDFGFATVEKVTKDFNMGSEPFMSPEVKGGIHVKLHHYSSRLADIWALGVILVNLTCGTFPWHKASMSDPDFFHYMVHDPDLLYHSYHISYELNDVLKSIFTANPRQRTSIKQLKERIRNMKAFSRPSRHCAAPATPAPAEPESTIPSSMVTGFIPLRLALDTDINRTDSADSTNWEALQDFPESPDGIDLLDALPVSSSTTSSFVGSRDEELIMHIEAMNIPETSSFSVSSSSDDQGEADSDSDDDDEPDEAITPETHAVDAAGGDVVVEAVADIPELALDAAESETKLSLADALPRTKHGNGQSPYLFMFGKAPTGKKPNPDVPVDCARPVARRSLNLLV